LREVLDWNNKGIGNQITKLEINCHGLPGRLVLPNLSPSGVVDHTSVAEFGALLRPNLSAGARIELLACKVAAVEFELTEDARSGILHPIDPKQPAATYSPSILDEYWRVYDTAPITMDSTKGTAIMQTGVQAHRTRVSIAIARQYEWGPKGNGLRFCLNLAAASGGIVRASDVSQVELLNSDPRIAVDTIGNWEGHVWDFFPDGRVKYLGLNLPRSQGHIAFTGEHLASIGIRPMGSIDAQSPLRGQRLNRVPLAA